jgi:predicted metal-binding protein
MGKSSGNLKNILSLSKPEADEYVSFRSNTGISGATLALLHEKGQQYGVEAIQPFSTDELVIAQWVNLKCRYGCSQYKTNWSCPPATPELTEIRTILSEYSTFLLLVSHQSRNDFYKNSNRNRSDQVKHWKGIVSLERMLFLKGYDKAISLVSGSCSLCRKCAYPDACRFPMEKRPTIESFCIDLVGTLKKLGIDIKVAKELHETFKYYSLILLD